MLAVEPEPCLRERAAAAAIAAAGFTVEWMDRFRFPGSRVPSPTAPQVLGVAVRP